MSKLYNLLNEVRKDEEGAAMAEYVVLLGIVTGLLITAITAFSGVLSTQFTKICTTLGGTC